MINTCSVTDNADKKFKNGKIRFVILNKLGEAELSDDVSEDDISLAIEALRS